MNSNPTREFPKNLKHEEAERRAPRHAPPFRFVPDRTVIKDLEAGEVTDKLKPIEVELALKTTTKLFRTSLQMSKTF